MERRESRDWYRIMHERQRNYEHENWVWYTRIRSVFFHF